MENVESIYPLSAAQRGILLRMLRAPGLREYVEQVEWTVRGAYDGAAFEAAWRHVVARHPVLRSAFFWEGLDEPVQVVRREAALPVERLDWRGVPAAAREARLRALEREDRARGFDFAAAPLARLTEVRTGDDEVRFLWSYHHLVLDGWALSVCLREVFAAYEALRGGTSPRAERALPYAAYVAWLREQDEAEAAAFWRAALAGVDGPTPLGSAREAPGGERYATAAATLPAALGERLRAVAREGRLTLNTLVQGAWGLLLAHHSGEDDVLFGAVVSGRPPGLAGADGMLGVCTGEVPVRVRADPAAPLLPWLREIQDAQADARRFEWSGRPAGGRPFDTLVVFQNLPDIAVAPRAVAGAEVGGFRRVPTGAGLGYALVLEAVPERELALGLTHDLDRVDPATAERMLGHLRTLLEGFAADPARPVGALSPLSAEERARVLAEWNPAGRVPSRGGSLHERFAARAAESPHAAAVVSGDRSLTYGELDARADRLARRLRGLGAGPEARVGLCLERGPELVVAVLGVLRAGAAYVPLDPGHPAGRLAHVLADAGVAVLVTQEEVRAVLPEFGGETVLVDESDTAPSPDPSPASGRGENGTGRSALPQNWGRVASPSEPGGGALTDASSVSRGHERVAPLPLAGEGLGRGPAEDMPEFDFPVSPDNAAYVIYTSGSTGAPKGVVVTHANVLRLFDATEELFGFGPDDVWTLFHSYAFDFSVWEMWGALLYGGRLVVVPRETSRDPEAFRDLLVRERVTVLSQTPSAFRQLAAVDAAAGGGGLALRWTVFGGEALEPRSLAGWLDRHGDERPRLVNMYGITETTVHVTFRPVTRADVEAEAASPIGRALPDLRCYVLDARGEPAGVGVPGELCVGGAGVARGYLGRPGLTAERFVPDTFSGEAGARLYRSGDRARWLPAGELEYLGRTDQQVKVRGFRIEPGEVEAALLRHPGVADAAVVAREDAPGERRLVAYFVPAGAPVDAAALRASLAERLPDHMVPAALVELERLPLTPNGKLDRRALPAPGGALSGRPYQAPRTRAEEVLAAVWAEVLGAERVGVHDDFFELGGDSILALQVVARAHRRGVRVRPADVFSLPSVARLAEAASTAADGAGEAAPDGEVPLTPVQRAFFAREVPDRAHWNLSLLLELRRPVAPGVLRAALRETAARHDALRLRFRREGGEWRQRTDAAGEVPLTTVDVSRTGEADAVLSALQRSLDLEDGPLARAALLERGGGLPQRLLLAAHHLATDGVSWRVLVEELEEACARLEAGEPAALPAASTPFRAWAERLAEHARSGGFDAELPWWLEQGARAAARLPVDLPGGGNRTGSARSVEAALSAAETDALLREVPAAYRTQVADVLLAALVRALGAWTGERAVRVELEGHGREDLFEGVDLSRTVGWFTTLFPVVLDPGADPSPGAALRAVKEQLRAVPGRGIGFGALRWLAGDARTRGALAGLPAPEVSFNYLGRFDATLGPRSRFALVPGPAGEERSPGAERAHLLEVDAMVEGGRLRVRWTYGAELHRRATVERLAAAFAAELRGIVAHCTAPGAGGCTPSDFPLAGLGPAALDAVVGADREVEDLYPLSPMQEGILLHTLMEPGSGVYVGQFSFDLLGRLDERAFERAWQGVTERHTALRAAFVWEGVERPLQAVRRRAAVPVAREDWRGLSAGEREARLEAYLAADRARGFDPRAAPLMRLALFRTGEEEHRAVWTHHHLAMDGWSLPVVLREAVALYDAAAGGPEARLAPARPYRDYVAWLERRDPGAEEAFWREELAGFLAPTPLGVDRVQGGAAPAGYDRRETRLPATLTAELRELARRHGLTLSTVVQGTWALLLSRCSGEEEVLFGATVSGRPAELPGVEEMVGLFINTLPVRVPVPPAERVLPWLAALQARQARLREHESTPLARVQRWSDVAPGEPLFESIVVFENYPSGPLPRRGGGSLRVVPGPAREQTSYPLSLGVVPGEEMRVRLEYALPRLAPDAVERLGRQLRTLLEEVAAGPGRRLGELSPLDAAERRRVLEEWNATGREWEDASLTHEAFVACAARFPDAPALLEGGRAVTYAEAERRSAALARRLRARGVGPETRVGIWAERRAETVVAVLAVLRAGGAFVPLDPLHPAERLAHAVEDAGIGLLVAAGAPGGLPAGVEVVPADAPDGEGADGAPLPEVDPGTAAYVIYTSGSTGRPKGVVVEHRSIVNLLRTSVETFGFRAGDVFASLASPTFDIWHLEALAPLLTGAAARLLPSPALLDDRRFAEELEDASVVHAVPALLRQVLTVARASERGTLPRMRRVLVGGEMVPPELIAEAGAVFPDARVIILYGPTEATVLSTSDPVSGPVSGHPIGRPLANVRLYVLGRDLGAAPVGAPGELCIGGAGVGRVYLGRPDLTADRFVPDPFGGEAGARLYRSGDRVRWLPDGRVEFLGRTDRQVKVRGFRVEPGEVEAALESHPAVAGAVVVPRPDGAGGTRLVAYVVAAAGADAGPAALRAHLRERLPEHMVPSAFVAMEAFPLNANRKVDRGALPAPEAVEAEREPAAPLTPTERAVAEVWEEALGTGRVGIGDNFFDLGGHSLLLVRVHARLRERFPGRVELIDLFEHRTLGALAAHLDRRPAEPAPAERAAERGEARRARTQTYRAARAGRGTGGNPRGAASDE